MRPVVFSGHNAEVSEPETSLNKRVEQPLHDAISDMGFHSLSGQDL